MLSCVHAPLALLASLVTLVTGPHGTETLSGRVLDAGGEAVAGALVFVCPVNHRAGIGTSCAYLQGRPPQRAAYYCPSCQADRGSRTVTDAEGRFLFEGLDPDFNHFTVAVKEGFRPQLLGDERLREGEPIVLAALGEERLAPTRVHRGRVLRPDGSPAADATVRVVGVDTPGGRLWMERKADYMAVTDEGGRFLITTDEPALSLWVRVRAAGCARAVLHLRHADAPHEIRLLAGASLHGRLVHSGEPLAGMSVGLVQEERAPHAFLGDWRTHTDAHGAFRFDCVPAGAAYHVFGAMGELPDGLVVPARRVEVAQGATRAELGELSPAPGHRIAGRVLVSDAQLAQGTQVLVMRSRAWDTRPFPIASDGRFELIGVPAEPVMLSVYAPGLRLSDRNPSLDPDDVFRRIVTGRVEGDVEDLVLHLVPRERIPDPPAPLDGPHPASRPLRGARASGL